MWRWCFILHVIPEGGIVTGVDYSEEAIDFAKEKTKGLKIDFKRGSVYELPFENDEFDAVVSSDVIEHLEDVERYISEIKRVVKKNGVIVISTPIRFTEHPLDHEHIVEWFPGEFKNMISRNFPKSDFYYSHSLVMKEIFECTLFGKRLPRAFLNFISFFNNPFDGFNTRFTYKTLQYSVSRNV